MKVVFTLLLWYLTHWYHNRYWHLRAGLVNHGAVSYQHYGDVIMGAIASQITSLTIVYSIVYSDADQRKHQSSASLAFVRGIHRGPVNTPHKWPVTRNMFPFDDVIMIWASVVKESQMNLPSACGWTRHPNISKSQAVLITGFTLLGDGNIAAVWRLTGTPGCSREVCNGCLVTTRPRESDGKLDLRKHLWGVTVTHLAPP